MNAWTSPSAISKTKGYSTFERRVSFRRLHRKECEKEACEPSVHGLFCAVNCRQIRPYEASRHIQVL